MTLAEKLSSRGNAITLLRLGFAALVVFGHAYEVGGFGPDPLARTTGLTCGELGVNAFFAMSGFLVTQSWVRSRSTVDYLWKRALRILPGFWLCLLATGLLLFPWLWARQHGTGWVDAFRMAPLLDYVKHNALLRIRQSTIGDLFATHPAAGVVNGALWSLFPEFLCYLGVAAAGVLNCFRPRRQWLLWLTAMLVFLFHLIGPTVLARLQDNPFQGQAWYLWRLATQGSFFVFGALLVPFAARVTVSIPLTLVAVTVLVLATSLNLYSSVGPWLLPLIVLQLAALLPGAWLERIGDYSYGLYVYHYPLQQSLISLGWRGASAGLFFAGTLALALPLAVLVWHLVENPALRLKGRRGPVPAAAPA